jgi:hypothetical protein
MVGEDLSRNRADAPPLRDDGRLQDCGMMKECR